MLSSYLGKGNRALQAGNNSEAISHYVRALQEAPALAKVIAGNIQLARKRYRSACNESERKRVAVCGWELAHHAARRVLSLTKIYATFADVEIIGSLFPQWGKELWEPIRESFIPHHTFVVEDESRFLEQAVELVVAHPYDIVHLSNPRMPNIFFGILYKLVWDARVFVDIDDEELNFDSAKTSVLVDEYLKSHGTYSEMKNLVGSDWTCLAVGLMNEFDGTTVSNHALQQRYGGTVLVNKQVLKNLIDDCYKIVVYQAQYKRLVRNEKLPAWLSFIVEQPNIDKVNERLLNRTPELTDRLLKIANRKRKKKAKVAIYTAIIGGYDQLIIPEFIVDDWDYIVYTDTLFEKNSSYELRKPPFHDPDPVRIARYIKTHPHELLREYNYVLWVDGNIFIKHDFLKVMQEIIEKDKALVFRKHPVRSCMYEEIEKCLELRKDDYGLMRRQLNKYIAEGVPSQLGLMETNVIFRKNTDDQVAQFNKLWWKEIATGSRRDQLSVMYALHKSGVKYDIFHETCDIRIPENPWYYLRPHHYNNLHKLSNIHPTQFILPKALDISYSNLKTPSKVIQTVLKLRNLGFVDKAFNELVNMYQEKQDVKFRQYAAWHLALYCLDCRDKELLQLTNHTIDFLKLKAKDETIKTYLNLIELESLIWQGVKIDSNQDFTSSPLYVDYMALLVNSQQETDKKIYFLNQIFLYYSLQKVRCMPSFQSSLLDSIYPERTIGRFEFTDSKVKVSVIVPCFNAAKTIYTAMFALMNQTWKNLEIIVVDDCSSDVSFEMALDLSKADSRIQVIRMEENSGPYLARNRGLEVATGDYITVADADDWHHPQKIQMQVQHLIKFKNVVANASCLLRATDNLEIKRRQGNPFFRQLNISSLMFSRKIVLERLGGWDAVRFSGDSEFYKRLIKIFGRDKVVELDIVTSIGRIDDSSLTGNSYFGYDGYPFGARKEYLEIYESFYEIATINELKYEKGVARYPIPKPMQPRTQKNLISTVDIVFVGDFRKEQVAIDAIDFIKKSHAKGIHCSLVHANSYSVDPRSRVDKKLRYYLRSVGKCLAVFGELLKAKQVIIDDIACLEFPQKYFPDIKSDNINVLVRETSFKQINETYLDQIAANISLRIQGTLRFFAYNDDVLQNIFNKEKPYGKYLIKKYRQDIVYLEDDKIKEFIYQGSSKIAVIMPCIDYKLGRRTAEILLHRSGIDCTIIVVMDNSRKGFINTLNSTAQVVCARFICYVAQDAFPGRNWLKKAFDAIEIDHKGLLGFNDGKWDGRIASFGMVRKEWVKQFYGGDILFGGYKSHGADNELTVIAKVTNNYIYCSDSVLIECDYEKDYGGSNMQDSMLFQNRFRSGFNGLIDIKSLERFKKEYKIR